jgi:hypothetical protein
LTWDLAGLNQVRRSGCGGDHGHHAGVLGTPFRGGVRVYGVHDFPSGTWIGRDAQKLQVVGPVWVRPPRPELTVAQWEKRQDILREAGFSVTVEPFWTSTPSDRDHLLEDVREELLRSAR